jgi:fumarate hydratase subunit beta
MENIKKINLPLTEKIVKELVAGEKVLLTGILYTARDAAHKKIVEALESGQDLPFSLQNESIYYVGPSPSKTGAIIGAAGPTTSYRMDSFAPVLIAKGLRGMIGKGQRSLEVVEAIKTYNAVYFAAVGGAAALLSKSIKKAEVIAYPELGPEAIRKLYVEDFPCYVAVDTQGNQIFK